MEMNFTKKVSLVLKPLFDDFCVKLNCEGEILLEEGKLGEESDFIESECSHVLKDFSFRRIFPEHVLGALKEKVTYSRSSGMKRTALRCLLLNGTLAVRMATPRRTSLENKFNFFS